MRRHAGFSLIELLAAAAIMGILATVAVPVIETTQRRAKERELRSALRDIRTAIDAYKVAADSGRVAKETGESGYPPNLAELTAGVKNLKDPSGPPLYFLRRIPRDPFSPDPKASAVESWGLRSFDSPPESPKAGKDVFDVYSTSPKEGMNGVPYSDW